MVAVRSWRLPSADASPHEQILPLVEVSELRTSFDLGMVALVIVLVILGWLHW